MAAPVTKRIKYSEQVGNLSPGLSEYEIIRQANIKRNEEFLASLGVEDVKSSLAASVVANKPSRKREISRKNKSVQNNVPLTRSAKIKIENLDQEILELTQQGDNEAAKDKIKILLNMKKELEPLPVDVNHERHSALPIAFTYMTNKTGCYWLPNDFSDLLKHLSTTVPDVVPTVAAPTGINEDDIRTLRNMRIHENEVARLTQERISSVCIHPSEHKLVVFAGDELGNFGCWDVQRTEESELDGVYKYHPHVSRIARIHAQPLQSTAIYSTSYDGTVRLFDVVKEQFVQVFGAPEGLSGVKFTFTDADFLYDEAECMYIGSSDGYAALADFRASNSAYMWKRACESGYRVYSIQQHPTVPHLIVAAEKNMISLYDVRKGSASSSTSLQALVTHTQHTSPGGEYLVSIEHDDTLRTWRNFTQPSVEADCIVTPHVNPSRYSFRPVFDPKHDHVFALGSMLHQRRIEVYNPVLHARLASSTSQSKQKTPAAGEDYSLELLCSLQDDQLDSVCVRNAFHPSLNVLAGGNSSGRVHIFRNT